MRATVLLCVLTLCAGLPGQEVREVNGVTCSIRVPRGWRPGGMMVAAFHGQGDVHTNFMRVLKTFDFLSDALLVVPDAPNNAAWEAADIDPVDGMLETLQEEFGPGRTIATGFSRGAFFAFGFGLEKPTRVRGVIPHSGGLIQAIPDDEEAKGQVFYVIHGTADAIVPVDQSRSAVRRLEEVGIKVEYEEVAGLAHTVDRAACERAFAWLEVNLGGLGLSDDEAEALLERIEDAAKDGEIAAAAEAWAEARGLSEKMQKKFAKLAKKHVEHDDEGLAAAAIQACAELGEEGVKALKKVPDEDEDRTIAAAEALGQNGTEKAIDALDKMLKDERTSVAVAAARALEMCGGDEAIEVLIDKLGDFEEDPAHAPRAEAIQAALEAVTGQTITTARMWKAWLKER